MSWIFSILDLVASVIDAATGAIVVVGVLAVTFEGLRSAVGRETRPLPLRAAMSSVRITLGQWLALALELALAADIVRSVVAPTWDEIGKLAAIAALRTVLNYFLEKEIERGSAPVAAEAH